MTIDDEVAVTAVALMEAIDLQVQRSSAEYSPWKCPSCGVNVYGKSECAKCMTKTLGYIVGNACARAYLMASIQYRDARTAVLESLGGTK